MTPDEIQTMRARAREYKEKTDVYVNGLRVPGGVRMPGADIANDLLRALGALEASRRECEELRRLRGQWGFKADSSEWGWRGWSDFFKAFDSVSQEATS